MFVKPFLVPNPVGDLVVAKTVYRRFPSSSSHRITSVDLVELEMLELDVILGTDWLHNVLTLLIVGGRWLGSDF